MPDIHTEDSTTTAPDLPVLLAGADHTELCRTLLAVAAMHEPVTERLTPRRRCPTPGS